MILTMHICVFLFGISMLWLHHGGHTMVYFAKPNKAGGVTYTPSKRYGITTAFSGWIIVLYAAFHILTYLTYPYGVHSPTEFIEGIIVAPIGVDTSRSS